jgi:alpha-tubulin suppressor-like RCC1 family protein
VTAVAAGGGHALALRRDGTVWSWGYNGFFYPAAPKAGQLGTDALEIGTSPRKVEGLSDVIAIAAGSGHSVALRRDGTVWVWGSNAYGQLGDGTAPREAGDVTAWRARPGQVGGLTDVIAIAAGGNHTLALKRDGTVWSWGHHGNGQLGGGSNPGPSCVRPKSSFDPVICTRPVQVLGSYGRSATLTNVRAITAGGNSSLALLNDGTVVGWGDNKDDQIGTAYRQKYPEFPSATPKWVSRDAPGVHAPLPVDEWDPRAPGVKPLTNVVAISAGSNHTLVLKGDGTVWSFGGNGQGQLGIEHTGDFSTKYPYAFPIPGLTGVKAIAAGGVHSVVVTEKR